MSQFNIQEHNFGLVEFNSNHTVKVSYLGNNYLTTSNFKGSCGCTSFTYDPYSKSLTVTLNMNASPTKEATIICNIPEGQEIIQLKATVK